MCVTFKAKAENPNEAAFDLNKPPAKSSTDEEEGNLFYRGDESAPVFAERQSKKKKEKLKGVEVDEDAYDADTMMSGKEDRQNMSKFLFWMLLRTDNFLRTKLC